MKGEMNPHQKALNRKYDKIFSENKVAKRMKSREEAKDIGRNLGTGHIANVLKRK